MITLYDRATTDFTHNGLVVLSDCKSALIVEELNGLYELTIEYPLDDRGKWQNLLEGNIIKADGQLFRIYRKKKNINSITVNARHIFYDLLDNFLEDVRPTSLNANNALAWILTRTQYAHSFTSYSDVANTNTKYFVKKNPVDAIMGKEGIIAGWGGELYRNNYAIQLLSTRGLDRGVLVAYGKNIQGIEETLDMSDLCTRLMPTGKDGLLLTAKYVNSPYINNYPHPVVKTVDFSDAANTTDLLTAATQYFTDSKCDIPKANYKVDFLELSKTEEYKNYAVLESVLLADTVTIKHSRLSLNLKAKVIKTTKNLLTNRLETVELGDFKGNIANTLGDFSSVITPAGKVKAGEVQGIIDATKAKMHAMADNTTPQTTKCIFFEDKDPLSATYGAMALGTQGFEIASVYGAEDWSWTTFGTGQGFIADLIVAGRLLGNNAEFNLDEGFLKITHTDGSYSKMDASGFFKHVASTNQDYHYLSEAGSVTIPSTNGIATFDITLDPAFKGKNFKVKVSIANSLNSSPYMGESLVSFACYVNSLDIVNGKATITGYTRWYDARELIGDQINGTSTAQFYFSDLIVTWVAIA